ncbi:MAG: hypothetical protein WCW87_00555 [Candidatus Paceibacterota bacterium]
MNHNINKRTFVLLGIIGAMALIPNIILAETNNPPKPINKPNGVIKDMKQDTKQVIQNERKDLKNDIHYIKENASTTGTSTRKQIEEKKIETKGIIKDEKQDLKNRVRIEQNKKLLDQTIKKLTAAYERLKTLAERIDSRIKKLESQNIDETKSKTILAQANLKITDVEQKIHLFSTTTISTMLSNATTTESTKVVTKKIKDSTSVIKQELQDIQKLLADSVNSLKPGFNKNATTTNATSTPDRNKFGTTTPKNPKK